MHITDRLICLHSTHMGTAIAEVQQQQYLECGDNLKIYNKKIFNFPPGLPHTALVVQSKGNSATFNRKTTFSITW